MSDISEMYEEQSTSSISLPGFIYCMSSRSMPDIVKVGETNDLKRRLNEANKQDTFRPPEPYTYDLAIETNNNKLKEKQIHSILEERGQRINLKKEFFRTTKREVELLFKLVDGVLIKNFNEIQDSDSELSIVAEQSNQQDNITVEYDGMTPEKFGQLSSKEKEKFKSWRRTRQGITRTKVADKVNGKGIIFKWKTETLSHVLIRDDHDWLTEEIRSLLKDCFP
jgi:hypothetical protein